VDVGGLSGRMDVDIQGREEEEEEEEEGEEVPAHVPRTASPARSPFFLHLSRTVFS